MDIVLYHDVAFFRHNQNAILFIAPQYDVQLACVVVYDIKVTLFTKLCVEMTGCGLYPFFFLLPQAYLISNSDRKYWRLYSFVF